MLRDTTTRGLSLGSISMRLRPSPGVSRTALPRSCSKASPHAWAPGASCDRHRGSRCATRRGPIPCTQQSRPSVGGIFHSPRDRRRARVKRTRLEHAHRRRKEDMVAVEWIEHELVHHRRNRRIIQPRAHRNPALSAIIAFVNSIPLCARIDRCRINRINCHRDHARMAHALGEIRPCLPPVARFIDVVVRGDVNDVRIFWVKLNNDDGIAAIAAREKQIQNGESRFYDFEEVRDRLRKATS